MITMGFGWGVGLITAGINALVSSFLGGYGEIRKKMGVQFAPTTHNVSFVPTATPRVTFVTRRR